MTDEAQQGLKDRDLQHYYESMEEMFTTPGWKYLLEDLQKVYEAAHTIEGIETMEQLQYRRGQIDILKLIAGQPAVISAAYEQLKADDNESSDI